VTPEEKTCFDTLNEAFNSVYREGIVDYVNRVRQPDDVSDDAWATAVTAKVSQFLLWRLVTEVMSTGVTLDQMVTFLRKNVKS
jgi:hypothetical protein